MKKVLLTVVFALVVVLGLVAQSDPFATRRFFNDEIEISFRVQDSEGRPQVKYVNGEEETQCYYDFDEYYVVLFDENENAIGIYGYSFVKEGDGLRLFDENGRFFDLESDNGKTAGDKVWEAVDVVLQSFLIYGGSGALIGSCGGPAGAVIGMSIGGALGIGKAFAHNIFGWV